MIEEPDEYGDPVHVHPAFGWGCLAAVLAVLILSRGCL